MVLRPTVGFGVYGIIVAVALGATWAYLTGTTTINPSNAPFLSNLTDWLWPSNLMLMAWHADGAWHATLGLLVSAFANGIIYSVVGLLVAAVRQLFVHPQS